MMTHSNLSIHTSGYCKINNLFSCIFGFK